ncbi:hypothetical protein BSKO_08455 [Bryopsis sp. KO-2023]|nr:hypothetical protein BSKO_08455 [Bryopsis sp. KO-2023]
MSEGAEQGLAERLAELSSIVSQLKDQVEQGSVDGDGGAGSAGAGPVGTTPQFARAKLKEPETFSGENLDEDPVDWLFTLKVFFGASGIEGTKEKRTYMASPLRGPARRWFKSLSDRVEEAGGVLPGFEEITKQLRAEFGLQNAELKARVALRSLAQHGDTVRHYTAKFRQLISYLPKATDAELLHNYIAGLKTFIRSRVEESQPTTLRAAIEQAERWSHQPGPFASISGSGHAGSSKTYGSRQVATVEEPEEFAQVFTIDNTGHVDFRKPVVFQNMRQLLTFFERAVRNPWLKTKFEQILEEEKSGNERTPQGDARRRPAFEQKVKPVLKTTPLEAKTVSFFECDDFVDFEEDDDSPFFMGVINETSSGVEKAGGEGPELMTTNGVPEQTNVHVTSDTTTGTSTVGDSGSGKGEPRCLLHSNVVIRGKQTPALLDTGAHAGGDWVAFDPNTGSNDDSRPTGG